MNDNVTAIDNTQSEAQIQFTSKHILLPRALLVLLVALFSAGIFGITWYFMGLANQTKSTSELSHSLIRGNNKLKITQPIKQQNDNSSALQETKKYIVNFQNQLGTHSSIVPTIDSEWITNNGNRIFIKGFGVALAVKKYDGVDQYKVIPESKDSLGNTVEDQAVLLQIINELKNKSDKYFLSQGFTLNIVNSNESHDGLYNAIDGNHLNGLSINRAYEKNGIFCLTYLTQVSYTFSSTSCSIVDNKQNKLSKEFTPVINSANNPKITVTVNWVSGDFAAGGVGGDGSGAGWYAKKINGVWTEILETQNGLPCSVTKQYSMPKELSKECVN